MLTKNQANQIAKHLRAVADILEKSNESGSQTNEQGQSKRGRKPGTVPDNVRCQGQNSDESRCKNRATQGTLCKKHTS